MKKENIRTINLVFLALIIGVAIGYFIFNDNRKTKNPEQLKMQSHDNSNDEKNEIWTCSMHPQIRQNEPGQCPICGMDLIPLSNNSSDDPSVIKMTEDAVKLSNIQTQMLGTASTRSNKVLNLSGKIQIDERSASSLVAHIPGRLEKLFVSYTGEPIKLQQKVATIYSPELINAQRELLEALHLQEVNPELLEAARNKLKYWKIGESAINAIELKGQIQETFTIFADVSGVVTNRRVSVGDYLQKGESLFDLIKLNKLWVIFDAYEEDLPNIKIGDKIEFSTPSIPNKIFKTRITFIDPVINAKTRTVSIRTEINNSGGLLKPDMFVNGSLQNKTHSQSLLTIPKSSVLWTGKRSVVYVKIPDMDIPSYEYREIEMGANLGNSYEVISGLEPGEEIVVNGSFAIDASAQLNNQMSMINRSVLIKKRNQSDELPDYHASTSVDFKRQLSDVSRAYLSLKDALVSTDASKAKQEADFILIKLQNVDMSLISGEAHLYWMNQLNSLKAHAKKISESIDVEEQRKQFDFLSQALIVSLKVYGIESDTFYIQHCPMANKNNGADWISTETEIRNPYFGEKMMTCGLITDTISQEILINKSTNMSEPSH